MVRGSCKDYRDKHESIRIRNDWLLKTFTDDIQTQIKVVNLNDAFFAKLS